MTVSDARPALDKAALEYFSAQVATDERWRELESVYLAAREALIAAAREEGRRETQEALEIERQVSQRMAEGKTRFFTENHALRIASGRLIEWAKRDGAYNRSELYWELEQRLAARPSEEVEP